LVFPTWWRETFPAIFSHVVTFPAFSFSLSTAYSRNRLAGQLLTKHEI
jgi:hypothetical protein